METPYSDNERARGEQHERSSDSDDSEPNSPAHTPMHGSTDVPISSSARRSSSVTSSPSRNRLQALKRTASISGVIQDEIQHEHNTTSENLLTAKTDSLDIGDGRPSAKRPKAIVLAPRPNSSIINSNSRRSSRGGSPGPPRGRSSPLTKTTDSVAKTGFRSLKNRPPRSPSTLRRKHAGSMLTDGDASDSQLSDCGFTASPPSFAATPELKAAASSPLNPTMADIQLTQLPLQTLLNPQQRDGFSSPSSYASEPIVHENGFTGQRVQSVNAAAQHFNPTTAANNAISSSVSLQEYGQHSQPWAADTHIRPNFDRPQPPPSRELLHVLRQPGATISGGATDMPSLFSEDRSTPMAEEADPTEN